MGKWIDEIVNRPIPFPSREFLNLRRLAIFAEKGSLFCEALHFPHLHQAELYEVFVFSLYEARIRSMASSEIASTLSCPLPCDQLRRNCANCMGSRKWEMVLLPGTQVGPEELGKKSASISIRWGNHKCVGQHEVTSTSVIFWQRVRAGTE